MTIKIELGPITTAALAKLLAIKTQPSTADGTLPQAKTTTKPRKYVRHKGEIGNDAFAHRYGIVQDSRLFRQGCAAIGVKPRQYGSNRWYIPEDKAEALYSAIKKIIRDGGYRNT